MYCQSNKNMAEDIMKERGKSGWLHTEQRELSHVSCSQKSHRGFSQAVGCVTIVWEWMTEVAYTVLCSWRSTQCFLQSFFHVCSCFHFSVDGASWISLSAHSSGIWPGAEDPCHRHSFRRSTAVSFFSLCDPMLFPPQCNFKTLGGLLGFGIATFWGKV